MQSGEAVTGRWGLPHEQNHTTSSHGWLHPGLQLQISQISDLCKVVSTQSTGAVMPTSTAAAKIHHLSIKKALAETGADPFAIAAEAMARAERLEARVRTLEALLGR